MEELDRHIHCHKVSSLSDTSILLSVVNGQHETARAVEASLEDCARMDEAEIISIHNVEKESVDDTASRLCSRLGD